MKTSGYKAATVRLAHNGRTAELLVPGSSDMESRQECLGSYPDLFKHFGQLERTQEGISAFASSYGLLGVPTAYTPASVKGGEKHTVWHGEAFSLWRQESWELGVALTLWETLNDDLAEDTLREHVRWVGEDVQIDTPPGGSVTSWLLLSDLPAHILKGDVRGPVLLWIQRAIDSRLAEHVTTRLVLGDKLELRFGYEPKNLLGALWLQLSEYVTGQVRINYCKAPGCGKPIEISGRYAHDDRKYCRNSSCSRRADRAKKRLQKVTP